jgi:hypothetical protein
MSAPVSPSCAHQVSSRAAAPAAAKSRVPGMSLKGLPRHDHQINQPSIPEHTERTESTRADQAPAAAPRSRRQPQQQQKGDEQDASSVEPVWVPLRPPPPPPPRISSPTQDAAGADAGCSRAAARAARAAARSARSTVAQSRGGSRPISSRSSYAVAKSVPARDGANTGAMFEVRACLSSGERISCGFWLVFTPPWCTIVDMPNAGVTVLSLGSSHDALLLGETQQGRMHHRVYRCFLRHALLNTGACTYQRELSSPSIRRISALCAAGGAGRPSVSVFWA